MAFSRNQKLCGWDARPDVVGAADSLFNLRRQAMHGEGDANHGAE
jgi:hypothetical protein